MLFYEQNKVVKKAEMLGKILHFGFLVLIFMLSNTALPGDSSLRSE